MIESYQPPLVDTGTDVKQYRVVSRQEDCLILKPEGFREQVIDFEVAALAVFAFQYNHCFIIGEFQNFLTAAAAGRAGFKTLASLPANNGYAPDASAAFRHHGPDGIGLSADTFGISGIFNIAAHMDVAVFIQNGGPHMKAGIGGMGFVAGAFRAGKQTVVTGHDRHPLSVPFLWLAGMFDHTRLALKGS